MKTLLFAAATAALAAVSTVTTAQQASEPALVTTRGEHTIKVAPDEAEISFMVSTMLKEAPEAQKANDAIVAKALAYLAEQDIPESDIRTTRVALRPHTEYVSDKERRKLYMAQQAIIFRLKDLDKLSDILPGLVDLGVNNIENVEFKSSNMKELQAKARAEAVLDAKAKAENLAEALGQRIGKAYQITDNTSGDDGARPVMYRMEAKAADSAASIAPGEIEIKAEVMVRFHLSD